MGNKSSAYVSSDGSSGNSDAAAALPGGSFQTIELAITCQKLHDSNVVSKMDPFVVVWLMRGSQWVEVTRTQIVDNCAHPVFDSVVARFNTEEVQSLRFIVYDAENGSGVDLRGKKIVGSVTTTVRDVMGCEAWHGELSSDKSSGSRGHIIVSAEKMLDNPIEISLQMRLEKVEQHEVFSTVAPFIRVSRYGTLGGPLMKVFSTERQKGKNVKFDAVTVSFQHLSNCDLNRNLKFEVFDHETSGKHNLLAETSMTLGQLQQRVSDGKGALGVPFNNCRKPGKPCETTMHFDYFQAKRVPTLYDYLKGGLNLSFVAGIDFTGSNGEASSMLSMIIGPDQQKKKEACARVYSSAIQEIGSILDTYDSDGQFAVYGFKETQVFALNGEENPYVHGVQGMVNAFTSSLDTVSLSGKTYLAPLIMKAAEIAAQRPPPGHPNQKYVGLIILTDGSVKDKKDVVEAMATIANHAMSIIIVVVGEDPSGTNIKEFETLKANCRVNTNRDMIQIIQLHAISELSQVAKSFTIARQMIKELPGQLVTYYTTLDIMPIHNSAETPTKFGNVNLHTM